MGGKRSGGKCPRGQKSRGWGRANDRESNNREAKDQGTRDRGANVLSPYRYNYSAISYTFASHASSASYHHINDNVIL